MVGSDHSELAAWRRQVMLALLGGAILLADRPFKRGDMIEVEQRMAVIEYLKTL